MSLANTAQAQQPADHAKEREAIAALASAFGKAYTAAAAKSVADPVRRRRAAR